MGMLKRKKDLRDTPKAAPAAMQPQVVHTPQSPAEMPADSARVAGVSLELYAEISKGLADYGYDLGKASAIAASKGIPSDQWNQATSGWNERIKSDPAIAKQFNQLYTGRGS